MRDAWKDAGGGKERHSFLPFVFTAYFVTVGCIYSSNFQLFGVFLGSCLASNVVRNTRISPGNNIEDKSEITSATTNLRKRA
jgi:hypothetical protein